MINFVIKILKGGVLKVDNNKGSDFGRIVEIMENI